jgi:hypothetical protein
MVGFSRIAHHGLIGRRKNAILSHCSFCSSSRLTDSTGKLGRLVWFVSAYVQLVSCGRRTEKIDRRAAHPERLA